MILPIYMGLMRFQEIFKIITRVEVDWLATMWWLMRKMAAEQTMPIFLHQLMVASQECKCICQHTLRLTVMVILTMA